MLIYRISQGKSVAFQYYYSTQKESPKRHISWCLYEYKGPVKRLDTSNTTVPAMKKALQNLKNNAEFEKDGWSAFGRELSDAIFGFNLTRYYSLKNNTFMPIGRVQTPTLGLVVRRDAQIENHEKTIYYELFADLSIGNKTIRSKFIPQKDDTFLTDGKILESSHLQGKEFALKDRVLENIKISKKDSSEYAPLPFNLTKLNTYCSKKWGYNPDMASLTRT